MLGLGHPFSRHLLRTGRALAQKRGCRAAVLLGEAFLVLGWDRRLHAVAGAGGLALAPRFF